jgi:UDP-glucose 6-dehydrogenase
MSLSLLINQEKEHWLLVLHMVLGISMAMGLAKAGAEIIVNDIDKAKLDIAITNTRPMA